MAPQSSAQRPGAGGTLLILWQHAWRNALILAHYAVNFLLTLLVAGEVYLLLSDDVQVPDFVRSRIETELVTRGISATFDRAHFDPTGRIVLRGLRLGPKQFDEPILTAELAYIQLDRIKMLAGVPELARIKAEGVKLLCPSAISPSGVTETLIHTHGLDVSHRGETWMVNGVVARTSNLDVIARGELVLPAPDPSAPPVDLEALWRGFARHAPRIPRIREHLARFTDPRLEVSFSAAGSKSYAIEAKFSAVRWQDPELADVRGIDAATTIDVQDGRTAPIQVAAHAGEVSRADDVKIGALRMNAWWDGMPTAEDWVPAQFEASAANVTHRGQQLRAPVLEARNAGWPRIETSIRFMLGEEILDVAARGDVAARVGEVDVRGRFGRDWLARASDFLGRDVTYYATIDTPPDVSAHIAFPGNLEDASADFSILSGPIVARGVPLDRVRLRGHATSERVRLEHLELSKGDQHATGTYEDRLATRDNRLQIRGRMRPLEIAPWFGPWWRRFWEDYTFSGPPPEFAVDVRGNWLEGHRNVVTGWGRAENGAIHGHGYDSLELRFFIRPNFFDLYDATVVRPEGKLAGELQLYFRPGDRTPAWQQFDFRSSADLVELAGIFGESGHTLFEPYRYDKPPHVAARGRIENEDDTFETNIELAIETENEFRYNDFPFESLSTDVVIHNRDVDLPRIHAGYAGGFIDGAATVTDGELRFDAMLADAHFDAAVEVFTDFLNRRSPPTPEELAQEGSGFAGRKVGGRLDIELAAEGPLTDFKAYTGSGSVRISEAELGRIKLFGLLVDVLGSVGIKAGVLSFHNAMSGLLVRNDHLLFPDARITGETAALETNGVYSLVDRSVEFRARLFPLRESSGVVTQIVGVMLDPFSNLLGVRLTGTLRQPRWIPTLAPSSSLADIDDEDATEATPESSPAPPPPDPIDEPAPAELEPPTTDQQPNGTDPKPGPP